MLRWARVLRAVRARVARVYASGVVWARVARVVRRRLLRMFSSDIRLAWAGRARMACVQWSAGGMKAPPSDSACVHLERLPCEAGRGRRCGSSSTCSWLADNGASGPRTTDVICGTGARLVGGGGVGPSPMCCPGARGARLVVANHDVAGPARPRPDQPGAAQPSPGEARPAQPRPAQAARRSSP